MLVDAVKIKRIDKLGVKTVKREVKEEGDIVDVEAVTKVTFECVNLSPADIGKLAGMIRQDWIDVFFGSPQAIMELDSDPEKAVAVS